VEVAMFNIRGDSKERRKGKHGFKPNRMLRRKWGVEWVVSRHSWSLYTTLTEQNPILIRNIIAGSIW